MATDWVERELDGIDLGDARRNRRAKKVLEALGAKPTPSIPTACGGWAEAQAAYRLFRHPDLSFEDILKPHGTCAWQRATGHPIRWCCACKTRPSWTSITSRSPA